MIRTRASREVYRNAWMTVREDDVELADGTRGVYGVVDKRDYALVVPRDADGVWLVEQYRYPLGRRCWEFPQGGWPAGRTGTPEELARAELREETGLTADAVVHLGRLASATGYSSQWFDVFLAEGLHPGPSAREASEQDMRCERVSTAELLARVRDGRFVDSDSLAAWTLLALHDAPPPHGPSR